MVLRVLIIESGRRIRFSLHRRVAAMPPWVDYVIRVIFFVVANSAVVVKPAAVVATAASGMGSSSAEHIFLVLQPVRAKPGTSRGPRGQFV